MTEKENPASRITAPWSQTMQPLALTIEEATNAGGPRRAKLYEEIRSGRLRAVKMGRCTRILVGDLQAYLTSLPAIAPRGAKPRDEGDHGRRRRSRRKAA